MRRTLALALFFGTAVLFASLYAAERGESLKIDLSGVGRCAELTLNVTSAWRWSQYPSSPSAAAAARVPDGFVGKNAIVWTDGALREFLVQGVDGRVITADRALGATGSCRFTLDAAGK